MRDDHNMSDAGIDRRRVLKGGASALAGAAIVAAAAGANAGSVADGSYAEPATPGLPPSNMMLDLQRAALVVIDPQKDFLHETGVAWGVVGENVKEIGTVANLERLFKAAKAIDLPTFVSPHYYYPTDYGWKFEGALEKVMHKIKMFDRKGPLDVTGFNGSGADWMPQYKPYIEDGKTIVVSPHKVYGPETNDLTLQLSKRRINQVILAGMSANLCVESHLRELLESGFEVAVVKDATAAAKIPEGDGYLSALINFRMIANAVLTTDDVVKALKPAK
ncbi:cysteine hydrolase [Ferrovibrio sp.]|uniref:cysteine hydrolase n=1 Tax=Ferrovibrio sp. TaxID=1917215 RepID=UPI00262C9BB7|nr:cysteine hydrolase [Ferrovibrio sp.]